MKDKKIEIKQDNGRWKLLVDGLVHGSYADFFTAQRHANLMDFVFKKSLESVERIQGKYN